MLKVPTITSIPRFNQSTKVLIAPGRRQLWFNAGGSIRRLKQAFHVTEKLWPLLGQHSTLDKQRHWVYFIRELKRFYADEERMVATIYRALRILKRPE